MFKEEFQSVGFAFPMQKNKTHTHERKKNPAIPPPPTPSHTQTHTIQTCESITNKIRVSRNVRERGNSSGLSIARKVYQSIIFGLKEGRRADQRSTSRSRITIFCNRNPNGGAATLQTCNEREGFDDHNRSQSTCFCVPMGQQHQPFFGFRFFFYWGRGGEEKGLLHSLWSTSSYYFIHNATDQ